MSTKVEARFWEKVDAWGAFACWEWTKAQDPYGYGRFWMDEGMRLAHRVAWQLLVGPISDGMTLDHLCRNPACVNPDHLDPVTHAENVRRGTSGVRQRSKTHCPRGHPYSGENLRIGRTRGERYCRTCQRARTRRERLLHPERVRARQRAYQARQRANKTPVNNTVDGNPAA